MAPKKRHADRFVKPKAEREARVGGRKSDYRPEFAAIARKLCVLGATDEDLAEAFGKALSTIKNWKRDYPDFASAIAEGKATPDDEVERALLQRALGYTHPAVKHFNHNGTIVEAHYTEHYPPDTAAARLWLTNRRPDQWRDRQVVEVTDSIAERLRRAQDRARGAE